jgi:hypothetical protein
MSTFWHLLIWACVFWYGTITLLVAVRGWWDIVGMLKRLRDGEE